MNKKFLAHTFAELMISLVVVSIIAALLYPMLAKFNPNTNKALFQAAYRTLTVIIGEIVQTTINGEMADINGVPYTNTQLCQEFCERANVVAECDAAGSCSTDCATLDDDNIITTTNGMRWHFNVINSNHIISVDVNSSNNSFLNQNHDSANVNGFGGNGVFTYSAGTGDNGIYTTAPDANGANAVFNMGNLKAQDSFWIRIDRRGKILDMSPAGWANLEDSARTLE